MAEMGGIPDDRCGYNLLEDGTADFPVGDCAQDILENFHLQQDGSACCWRETWKDTDQCIWHARVEDKPLKKLKAARTNNPEQLDGAYLVGVEIASSISFHGCGLRAAIFKDVTLPRAGFHDASLRHAQFHHVELPEAEFHNADLSYARFQHVELPESDFYNAELLLTEFDNVVLLLAKFRNASLPRVDFYDSRLTFAEFYDAKLFNAQFRSTNLYRAKFQGANFSGEDPPIHSLGGTDHSSAKFHDSDLLHADFRGTQLSNVVFCHSDISGGDYTDADARDADFSHATLHNALFTRTDCRGATFTNALLYETVFADARINSQTTFYDSGVSRPVVVYEKNPHALEGLSMDTHPLEAAEWVYRRLEKLHDENALSEEARKFHISKQEVRRKYQYELEDYPQYAISTLQWHVNGHGESIFRIFRSAAILILACGILYPFVGGIGSSSTGTVYSIPLTLSRIASLDGAATLLQGIYFSVITFTTIGYGDLYPIGVGSKVLVGFESLSGAILIALFVFVLGRRVAR
ncbi:pentapeptide repeat-containing protein [Halalkalicoccus jeotgali]|uniref:pentapeptide repeat-containing protein n=1 Tax=Halalkalicoccus jeotgali TaxID=413810 RepID=UPI0009DAB1A4|nr:pentapeptide repeat-containing protein [Halalkalicoccus jeotgali]